MTSLQIDYITASILNETRRLNSLATADDKFHSLNNIISLKKLINYNGHDSIYLDFKRYLRLYIEAVENKDSGYDNVDVLRVSTKLSGIVILDQISLLKFFKKILLTNGYTDEANECEQAIHKLKISFYQANKSFKNYCKLIALWSSVSVSRLIVLLFTFYVITSLFLMPAYFESLEFFKINYADLSSNNLINHLLNILTLFFDLESNCIKIEANNGFAIILIILAKVIYITVLINFLTMKLINFIKINE